MEEKKLCANNLEFLFKNLSLLSKSIPKTEQFMHCVIDICGAGRLFECQISQWQLRL